MEETKGRIVIGEADRTHLNKAAKWAQFIAIVQFVFIGLGIICVIFMLLGAGITGAAMSEMPGMHGTALGMSRGIMIFYAIFLLVMMAISFFLALYLYRFAGKTLEAIRNGNDAVMTEAFSNLGKYFKLSGILMIVTIVLSVLMAILAAFFTASALPRM